jgi:hypothetical protein
MQDEFTILRLIEIPLKGGRVQILGSNLNKSKFYSRRN